MDLIESLFPNAKIDIVYLKRSPAAIINGLYDGWKFRGFFSRNLSIFFNENNPTKHLMIKGYSEQYDWAKYWWNFELPSDWTNYIEDPLENICAFQWYSANETILNYLDKKNYYTVKFENIVKNEHTRMKTFQHLFDFLNISNDHKNYPALAKLPIIQATEHPSLYRWLKRKDIILSLLKEPKLETMCNCIGYDLNNLEEWL